MPGTFVPVSASPAPRWVRDRRRRALVAVSFAIAGVLAIWHSSGAPVSLDSSDLRGESSVSAFQRAGFGEDSKTAVEDGEDIMSSIRNFARPVRSPPKPAGPRDIPSSIMAAFLGQGGQTSPPRATQVVTARSTEPVDGQIGGGGSLSAQQEQNKAMFEAALHGQAAASGGAAASAVVAGDGESAEVRALKKQVHALAREVTALRTQHGARPESRQRGEEQRRRRPVLGRERDPSPRQARQAASGKEGAGVDSGARRQWMQRSRSGLAASPRGAARRSTGDVSALASASCVAPACTCVPHGTSEKLSLSGTFSLTR